VVVVEDGDEYSTNLNRFLSQDFDFTRAGDGQSALALLGVEAFALIFLDMKFDRAERLLGDELALQRRFAGDEARARVFLENNQGAYILSALREAGHTQPVLFSYDFDSEPRRLKNLQRRYGPLDYLNDTATPHDIRDRILRALPSG